MVPLPTPPGPDTTMMRGGAPGLGRAHPSGLEQRLTLLHAEALDAPVVGDADLLHDLAGLDLAHAGQRFEQGDDLELADVGVVGGQRFGERHRSVLQPRLDHSTSSAGLSSLRQCRGTLLRSQLRRCSHAGHGTRKRPRDTWMGPESRGTRHHPCAGDAAPSAQLAQHAGRLARGSANVAVPTWTATAPASISSSASHPVATPPTPMIGRSGRAAWTSWTARTATGWMAGPDSPPPPAPSAGRRVSRS